MLVYSQSKKAPIAAESRQRMGSSRATNCLCSCVIRRELPDQWTVGLVNAEHNHEPFSDPSVHPQGRALSTQQHQAVLTLCRAGVGVSHIETTLRMAAG